MILWACDGQPGYTDLTGFISERVWGNPCDMPGGTVMAVTDGSAVIGACLFHNWQPDCGVIEMTSASASPKWLTRKVLRQMFGYAFDEMGCQAAVLRVDPDNTRMCRIATAYGFQRYDIPRLRGRDKGEAIFLLTEESWRANGFHKDHAHG